MPRNIMSSNESSRQPYELSIQIPKKSGFANPFSGCNSPFYSRLHHDMRSIDVTPINNKL
jgi:hypothetical protein